MTDISWFHANFKISCEFKSDDKVIFVYMLCIHQPSNVCPLDPSRDDSSWLKNDRQGGHEEFHWKSGRK